MPQSISKFSIISTIIILLLVSLSPAQQPVFKETVVIENAENIIAVDNVCAWPNLTLMPDGSITAVIFNKPSHGQEEGNAVCYASTDGGRTWQFRGIPAPNDPGSNRMNLAAGLANDGSLVVLISGWGGEKISRVHTPQCGVPIERRRQNMVTGGAVSLCLRVNPDLSPFGDIVRLGGKTLAASAYGYIDRKSNPSYLLFSYDDGYTWGNAVPMGTFGDGPGTYNDFNETAPLRISANRWLAAVRTLKNGDLQLIVSEDEGKTWNIPDNMSNGGLTRRSEHPGHLLRLKDGRILLTYGIRWGVHGVGARISKDEGRTWSAPMVVIYYGGRDGGYPSSVELEDGTIVTAYYCDANENHPRYHMGAVRWKLP